MPSPHTQQVHINTALTNISVAYLQDDTHFIAEKIFPSVPVEHKTDDFYIFDKEDMRRDLVKPRAPGTESAGSGFDITTDTYQTKTYAYHKDLAWDIEANADPQLDLPTATTEFLSRLFLLNREVRWTATFFTSGVWGTDVQGVAAAPGAGQFLQWNDAGSNPKKDIDAGKATMLLNCGYEPNKLVVGYNVHQELTDHPLIRDQFKYTTAESITEQMIARFLEIDEYLISKASMVTSAKGAAATVNEMVAGKNALLVYTPASAGMMQPAAGYTFTWNGISGSSTSGVAISNFDMRELKSTRYEGEYAYADKVVGADLGYFFIDAVA